LLKNFLIGTFGDKKKSKVFIRSNFQPVDIEDILCDYQNDHTIDAMSFPILQEIKGVWFKGSVLKQNSTCKVLFNNEGISHIFSFHNYLEIILEVKSVFITQLNDCFLSGRYIFYPSCFFHFIRMYEYKIQNGSIQTDDGSKLPLLIPKKGILVLRTSLR